MANLERMYIISWFGTGEIRSKRVEYHNKQVDWAIQQGLEVFVVAQHYEPNEYRSDVTYLEYQYPEGITLFLPGEARNVCLKHYYQSDADFAIIADNDSILYDGEQHCDSKDFVKVFNSIELSNLAPVDLFVPLNPRRMPFSKTISDNQTLFDNNLVFHRTPDAKGSFIVTKNIKKHYGLELYYDESFVNPDRTLIPLEDVDFGMNFLYNGLSLYMLHNIILKELASTTSTWTATDDRKDMFPAGKNLMATKYNIPLIDGNMNYKEFYKRSKAKQSKLYVSKGGNAFSLEDFV
jgi:hypothetical protein